MVEVMRLLGKPPSQWNLTDLDEEFIRAALPKAYERWVKTRTA